MGRLCLARLATNCRLDVVKFSRRVLEKISWVAVSLEGTSRVEVAGGRKLLSVCCACVGLFLEGSTLVWDGFSFRSPGGNSGISQGVSHLMGVSASCELALGMDSSPGECATLKGGMFSVTEGSKRTSRFMFVQSARSTPVSGMFVGAYTFS